MVDMIGVGLKVRFGLRRRILRRSGMSLASPHVMIHFPPPLLQLTYIDNHFGYLHLVVIILVLSVVICCSTNGAEVIRCAIPCIGCIVAKLKLERFWPVAV